MDIRSFNFDKDYLDACAWWTKQDWPILQKDLLSDTGFIAHDDDTKYAVAWVYSTNSSIYILDWYVGNPDVDYKKRKEGLELIVDAAADFAKESGAKQLLTMTNNKRLSEKLKDMKFNETDRDMIHFVRSL